MKYKISIEQELQVPARVRFDVEFNTETKDAEIVTPGTVQAIESLTPYQVVRSLTDLDILTFGNLLDRVLNPRQLPVRAELDPSCDTVLEISSLGPSLLVGGVSSTNKRGEITISSIITESIERLKWPADPGRWAEQVIDRFYRFDGGTISDTERMVLRAKPCNDERAVLDIAFWGL